MSGRIAGVLESLRRFSGPIGLALLLASVMAAPMILSAEGRSLVSENDLYPSTGYNAIVDKLFIANQWVAGERAEDEGLQIVRLQQSAPLAARHFARRSSLLEDLRNPNIWRFNGRDLDRIDPWAHRQPGPFAAVKIWRGDVLFARAEADAVSLENVDSHARVTLLANRADGAKIVAVDPFGRVDIAAEGTDIVFSRYGQVAALRLIGETIVLRVPSGSGVEVRIRGRLVKPRGAATLAYGVVGPQDEISFSLPAENIVSVWRPSSADHAISRFRPGRDRLQHPDLASFADGLTSAMDTAVQTADARGRLKDRDVDTTLDEGLHSVFQQGLAESICTFRRGRGVADCAHGALSKPTFRAAATVMNTLSGEVLAIASYPANRAQLDARQRALSSGDRLVERNHNFTTLPIGSAAKPPFTAAILDNNPEFTTLVLHGSGGQSRFGSLLGVSFVYDGADPSKAGIDEEARGEPMDFDRFLVKSSNRYATALLLLASSSTPHADGTISTGPRESFDLDARQARRVMPVMPFQTNMVSTGAFLTGRPDEGLTALPWVKSMGRMFDIAFASKVEGEGSPVDTEDYDVRPWRNLFGCRDTVECRRMWPTVQRRAFVQVSPERENFGLNNVQSVRNDYVMLILGNGRSRWTTLKLAEAYSRIVLNRTISATFIPGPEPQQEPLFAKTSDEARKTLVRQLERVALEGTARGLRQSSVFKAAEVRARSRGELIRVFAKTGTPTVSETASDNALTALNEALQVGRRLLIWREADKAIAINAPVGTSAIQFLKTDALAARLLVRNNLSAEDFVRAVRLMNGLSSADRTARFEFDANSGQLRGIKPTATEPHNGSVIAFVVGRYCPGDLPEAPIAALSVVVNVQQKDGDNNLGLRFVGQPAVMGQLMQKLERLEGRRCATAGGAN